MYLGIERNSGNIYEGMSAPQFAIWPRPAVSLAKAIDGPADWTALPATISTTPFVWVFREDSFDPVTRVRRGRLFEAYPSGVQPQLWPVAALPHDHDSVREIAASRGLSKELYTYWPCQSILARPNCGLGTLLALGTGRAASAWRVIQVEPLVDEDILVTLKALSAYGVLPEINKTKIADTHRDAVSRAIDRVLDAAFRETPISVIDHCRNAAQVVLSRWMVQEGADEKVLAKDLDQVCKLVEQAFKKSAARDAANIIRLLHSRGKANKQEIEGLRVSVEEDAELSIHALGFLLREVNWAA
jgi:hypothetical protein